MAKELNITNDTMKFTEIFFNIEDTRFSVHFLLNTNPSDGSAFEREFVYDIKRNEYQNALHSHMYWELFIRVMREFTIDFEDQTITVKPGDCVLIPPGVKHIANYREKPYPEALSFSFRKNRLYKRGSFYDQLTTLLGTEHRLFKQSSSNMSDSYFNLIKCLSAGNHILACRYFYNIITDVISQSINIPRKDPSKMLPDTDILRSRRIMRLVEKYYTDDISLKSVADELNLSVRQTTRIIRATTGHTLGELVSAKRMDAARNLLLKNRYTISEISEKVGYNSLSCFYSAFRKHYGMLPKEYRQQILNEVKTDEQVSLSEQG